ncbi:ATP-binding cassette domain-containing protein [Leifsonia shinshuensis]|uniref:ATP-binding cassette domain-containing protein n=1 Tax=Leifsonia shinshuensis TaxID=150026 RepID=UPI0016277C72|nr:ABC transporter ATP-binding protein [Leifsonia shinshuensis]
MNRLPQQRTADEAIAVERFAVAYRTDAGLVPAVSDVSFALRRSERLAIVGESGSGKTTLAMAIAGLLSHDTAQIDYRMARVAGTPVDMRASSSVIPVRHEGVSMIFQDAMTSLDPVATIGHQFRSVLGAHGGSRRSRIRSESLQWIERVGIPNPQRVLKLRPYELSGGMRQRVMIALALCSDPAVLIADEPTSALDVVVSRRIMDLVLTLAVELGTAVIVITHDIDLARKYTDRMLVLYQGEVQDLCDTAGLAEEEHSPYTRALLDCVPRLHDHDRESLPTLARAVGREAS